uniref:Uncharacterized protein n=1 Tax=Salix viminalis TaxID=40686 RepID=A0A6N2MGT2_SALVM
MIFSLKFPIISWQADKIDAALPKCLHAMQDEDAIFQATEKKPECHGIWRDQHRWWNSPLRLVKWIQIRLLAGKKAIKMILPENLSNRI